MSDFDFQARDKRVIQSFTAKLADEGPLLTTDGRQLWMGDTVIAEWKGKSIVFHVERIEQFVRRAMHRKRRR